MVKVFGRDLMTDEATANRIADILNQVRGVTDVFVFRSLGQPNIVIRPDRAGRLALRTQLRRRFRHRAGRDRRPDRHPGAGRRPQLRPGGAMEARSTARTLWRCAISASTCRPAATYRWDRSRKSRPPRAPRSYIEGTCSATCRCDSRSADAIWRAPLRKSRTGSPKQVQLPEGIHLEWVGEYSELQAANRRLAIVIPMALLLIMGVLYAATLSIAQYAHPDGAGSAGLSRRRVGPGDNRHAIQRLRRGGFYLDLRDRDHGRHPAEFLHPPTLEARGTPPWTRLSWVPTAVFVP